MEKKKQTKFGTAILCGDGYYHITSRKEGNCGKKLSRLIYEDYYGVKLSSETHIHHIDDCCSSIADINSFSYLAGDSLSSCLGNLCGVYF